MLRATQCLFHLNATLKKNNMNLSCKNNGKCFCCSFRRRVFREAKSIIFLFIIRNLPLSIQGNVNMIRRNGIARLGLFRVTTEKTVILMT